MNKLTKLLSVFVIAGAVGAGVATMAGCGHTHKGTLHEAVAATCTTDGSIAYYTCEGTDCAGKYFEDEACTKEITNIVIPATGHTEVYNDKGDGTHGITCQHGDLTETTEAHIDADNNGKCDKCEVNIVSFGKYFELSGQVTFEMELKTGYKLVYNGVEYDASSLLTSDSVEITVEGVKHTLTRTENGYKDTYSTNNNTAVLYWFTLNDEIATETSEFVGVYEGEYNYTLYSTTYKVTKFAITSTGMVQFTDAEVYKENNEEKTKDAIVSLKDGTISVVTNNDFKIDNWHFIATKAENGAVTEILLTIDGLGTATFTKTTEAVSEVPASMDLTEKTAYSGTLADTTYQLVVNESTANYKYTLNGIEVKLISGNATDGYLVYNFGENYVLKINGTTVELYEADGTTKIVDMVQLDTTIPTVNPDGATLNNSAKQDLFCGYDYYYYKVETAGYYTFTAGAGAVKIYTSVDSETLSPSMSADTVLNLTSGKSKFVYLNANSYIALESNAVGFTAVRSDEEPTIVIDYESFTDGKYEITEFDGADTYYVQGTAATAGKYYVSVSSTVKTTAGKECLVFKIDDVEYGSYYNSESWKIEAKAAGTEYSADLAAGAVVKVALSTEMTSWDYGTVTVYFESEAQRTARLAEEATAPTFSGDQLGDYECGSDVYTISETGIALNDDALTFVKKYSGIYIYELDDITYIFSFNKNGTLNVAIDGSDYTAVKPVEVTFTAEQQGTYLYSYTNNWGGTITLKYDIDADSLTYVGSYYSEKLTCISLKDGVYTFINGYGDTMTFSFVDGKMEVTADDINYMEEAYTAAKLPTASFTAEQQGTYAYASVDDNGTSYIIYTVGASSVTLVGYYSEELTCISIEDGVYTFQDSYGSSMTFSFVDGKMAVSLDDINYMDEGYTATKLTTTSFTEEQQGTYKYSVSEYMSFTYVIKEDSVSFNGSDGVFISLDEGVYTFVCGGSELKFSFAANGNLNVTANPYNADAHEAVKETVDTVAKVGVNTVQVGKSGSVDIEFSVPGTYKITYNTSDNVWYIELNGSTYTGAAFTVTDSVTITVYASTNASLSKFTITEAQATGGEEETFSGFTAAQQGTYNYSGVMRKSFVVGENTITTDFYGEMVLSYVSFANDEYTFTGSDSEGTYTFKFKFDNDGNMVITADDMFGLAGATAVKEASEEETFSGFTAAQQGTYNYSGVMRKSFVVGENTITTDFYGEMVLSYVSFANDEYTFTGSDSEGTYTFKFKFDNDGNMVITADDMFGLAGATAVKEA
ncbi:MAG: hypothetical protein ACI4QN_05075 [Candidatus Coproplasma sp.]